MARAERRVVERYHLESPAVLESIDGNRGTDSHDCSIRDISSAGAFFMTSKPFELGQRVSAKIALGKHGVVVSVIGMVIRRNFSGVALKFDRKYQIFGPASRY